jgi:hypothetical protein
MAWMKYFEPADQPELVRFGLWQNEQVGPSLRCPAWKLGDTPSVPWQALHLLLSTIARRPVEPVATCHTFGAGTLRPPCALPSAGSFGIHL